MFSRRSVIGMAVAVVAGLGVFAATGVADDHSKGKGKEKDAKKGYVTLTPGTLAPNFTLKDQDGNDVSLSDYKDKVVVLEWFNNECPFVVKFYKEGHMNEWAKAYAGKDVVWLAINSSSKHDVAHNKTVAGEWKIDRPVLSDASGDVFRAYGAKVTPHMYVIAKDGKIAYVGAIDNKKSTDTADIKDATNYVAQALDEILADKSVSTPQTDAYGCSVKNK
jgi:peroxiredoxin